MVGLGVRDLISAANDSLRPKQKATCIPGNRSTGRQVAFCIKDVFSCAQPGAGLHHPAPHERGDDRQHQPHYREHPEQAGPLAMLIKQKTCQLSGQKTEHEESPKSYPCMAANSISLISPASGALPCNRWCGITYSAYWEGRFR